MTFHRPRKHFQRGIQFPKCYSAKVEHQDLTRRGDGKPTRSPLSFGTPPCRLAVAWRSLINTILKPMRKDLNRFAEVSPTIVAPNHLSLYGSQKVVSEGVCHCKTQSSKALREFCRKSTHRNVKVHRRPFHCCCHLSPRGVVDSSLSCDTSL